MDKALNDLFSWNIGGEKAYMTCRLLVDIGDMFYILYQQEIDDYAQENAKDSLDHRLFI